MSPVEMVNEVKVEVIAKLYERYQRVSKRTISPFRLFRECLILRRMQRAIGK